jgi:hypothetical protein
VGSSVTSRLLILDLFHEDSIEIEVSDKWQTFDGFCRLAYVSIKSPDCTVILLIWPQETCDSQVIILFLKFSS